jgi:hypothetical protein
MSQDKIRIEAFNLYNFVQQIEEAARVGYGSTDTNEGMPQSLGPAMYFCDMVRTAETVEEEEAEKVEAEQPTGDMVATPELLVADSASTVAEPVAEPVAEVKQTAVRKPRAKNKNPK